MKNSNGSIFTITHESISSRKKILKKLKFHYDEILK